MSLVHIFFNSAYNFELRRRLSFFYYYSLKFKYTIMCAQMYFLCSYVYLNLCIENICNKTWSAWNWNQIFLSYNWKSVGIEIFKKMSADYSKLKNFVDESKGSSATSSSFNNAKDLMSGFFMKNPFGSNFSAPSRPGNQSIDDQTESWFRESENDPYCPKLVSYFKRLLLNQLFLFKLNF